MKKRTMSSKMSKSHDKFAYKPENYMFQGNASWSAQAKACLPENIFRKAFFRNC